MTELSDILDIILYQDDDILVVNKPSGLLTIEDGYKCNAPNLRHLIRHYFEDIWIVHRLDRETSGILVVARNKPAYQSLNQQFEQRKVLKTYNAITVGVPDWNHQSINLPLRVNGDRKHRTVVANLTGKPAQTDINVIQRFSQFSIVAAIPHSGYTHQIRAHLSAIGYPILSDSLYGSKEKIPEQQLLISRLALHACKIQFTHPTTNVVVEFQSPYPVDFSQTIINITSQYGI